MNHRLIVIWLLLGLMAPTGRALGADEGKHPRSVLEGVKELEKPVTYTETKIPLGELIQKVAQDTGVPLTASRDVADEPVAVVVTDFPARELLEQIADLLDYRWSASRRTTNDQRPTPGNTTSPPHHLITRRAQGLTPNTQRLTPVFEIYQDLASKQREQSLRDARLREVEKRFREALTHYLDFARLSPEQVEALRREAKARGEKLKAMTPDQLRAFLERPEEKEWSRRYEPMTWLWSPITHSVARLLGSMTPQQWATLLRDEKLIFSTDPRSGEPRLPADVERTFRASQPSRRPAEMRGIGTPEQEEREIQRERESREQWAAATGFHVVIRLETGRYQPSAFLALTADALPVRSAAPPESYSFTGGNGTNLSIHSANVDGDQWREEDTPERRAALGADALLGSRKRFAPKAEPRIDPLIGPQGGRRWWLRDLLPDIARTYDVDILSDAYDYPYGTLDRDYLGGAELALFELLDRAAGGRFRWDRQGTLIRLRSRTWFYDRPRQIPMRLTRRWQQLFDRYGALPLDECLTIVTTLSEPQMYSLTSSYRESGLPLDLAWVVASRHALRLYTALSPLQRQALWSKRPLPAAQMTPQQQALFATALRERARLSAASPSPEQVAAGRLSLTAGAFVRIKEQRGDTITYREERPSPPGAPPAPPRRDEVARYPVTRLEFVAEYGPGLRDEVLIYVPRVEKERGDEPPER